MACRVPEQDLPVGLELGHYHLIEKIGAGGMGEVYRACDEHLARDVAIKVLPGGTLTDRSSRKRFHKEALILSQLNHPNVASIYDFDTQLGIDFLVMEYIPGITLSAKLAAGPLPEKHVLHLGMQLAEGLAAAHHHGVIHCDIKPGNLRITSDGHLKILDFGLAKLRVPVSATARTDSCTEDFGITGTLPYMAPEQLLGREVDARTDIHAAGLVLYEMATGQRPFDDAQRQELIGAMLRDPPLSPASLKAMSSPELQRIIWKCLEKEPENRYQSADELAIDLRRLASPASSGIRDITEFPASKQRRLYVAGFVGLALLALMTLLFATDFGGIRTRISGHHTAIRIIAVLPLENLSRNQDKEYLVDGMTDELITELARMKELRVISRTSVMHYKGTTRTLPQIAHELNADAIVEGTVLLDGDHLRVTAQLIQARTDTHLWAENYRRDIGQFWAIPIEIARAIAGQIQLHPTAQQQVPSPTSPSATLASQDAYLKGRYYMQQGTEDAMREAKAYFEEAVRLDAHSAPAYAGLADYYSLTNELSPRFAMQKAREYVEKALAIDDSLADAHATLAYIRFYGDWNWELADQEFRRAIALSPSYAEAHRLYAEFLSEMGRHDQAVTEIQAAQELDPLSETTTLSVGWTFYYFRDYAHALEQCRKVLDLNPHSVSARDCVASALLATQSYDEAISDYESLVTSTGNDPLRLAGLGCAYALAGRKLQAEKVIARLNAASAVHYVPPYFFGLVYAALGQKDKAFSWLEKAYNEHDSYLVRLKVESIVDPLRADPRFAALLRRMNF